MAIVTGDLYKDLYYTFQSDNSGNVAAIPFYNRPYSEKDIREMTSPYYINFSGVYDLENNDTPHIILSNTLTGINEYIYDTNGIRKGRLIYAQWAVSPYKYPLFYTIK